MELKSEENRLGGTPPNSAHPHGGQGRRAIIRINRTQTISGEPIKRVRDFLRHHRDGSWSNEAVSLYFKLNDAAAFMLSHAMVEQGLTELSKSASNRFGEDRYEITSLGVRLCAAHLLKPIPRSRAEQLVAEFLKRVRDVNDRGDLQYRVRQVIAFGSYIAATEDVADIDLVVDLERKTPPPGIDVARWHLEYAQASGRQFTSYLDMLGYSEMEVRRLLKARSPYLAFHHMDDLKALNTQTRVLFSV